MSATLLEELWYNLEHALFPEQIYATAYIQSKGMRKCLAETFTNWLNRTGGLVLVMPLLLKLHLLHVVFFLLCGLPLLCGQQLTSDGRTVHTVQVGSTRHFTVHTPNRVASSVVLLLHPTTEAKDDQPLAPAIAFEKSIPDRFAQWYETGAVLVFLASRQVVDRDGAKKYCWGVGTDNNLCSAPLEGKEDEMFVLQVLDWLERRSSPLPTYLFGWSGGGRMAWRLACNNTLAPRFVGIAASSSLLAAELRAAPTSCSVATSPPLVVLHGTDDKTTPVNFDDASVAWTSSKAACSSVVTAKAVGQQPLSERQVHGECGAARTCFALVYYRQVAISIQCVCVCVCVCMRMYICVCGK